MRGRPSADAAARRDRHLLEVARGLFLGHGYQHVSIALIARTAGVAARTIYTRFGGKCALLRAIVEDEYAQRRRHAEELAAQVRDIEATLGSLARQMLGTVLCARLRAFEADLVSARDQVPASGLRTLLGAAWGKVLEAVFATEQWGSRCTLRCDRQVLADLFMGCVLGRHLLGLAGSSAGGLSPQQIERVAADGLVAFLGVTVTANTAGQG